MPWKDFKVPYKMILDMLKSKGIKVFHRKLKKDVGGLYNPTNTNISISKDLKNTESGCYTLLHEFAHWSQHREGKFKLFFSDNFEYTEENFNLILEAEMDAVKTAKQLLKTFGVTYDPPELTKSGRKDVIEFWRRYYLGDKN